MLAMTNFIVHITQDNWINGLHQQIEYSALQISALQDAAPEPPWVLVYNLSVLPQWLISYGASSKGKFATTAISITLLAENQFELIYSNKDKWKTDPCWKSCTDSLLIKVTPNLVT